MPNLGFTNTWTRTVFLQILNTPVVDQTTTGEVAIHPGRYGSVKVRDIFFKVKEM